ncbi:hypothetical protein [Cupriavidus necator]
MTTSFRFPSQFAGTKSAATGRMPNPETTMTMPSPVPSHGAGKEMTGAFSPAPFGMLTVGIPTEASDSPPAIRFGTLAVTITAEDLSQIRGALAGAPDGAVFAVSAALCGGQWKALSCVPTVASHLPGSPAVEAQRPSASAAPPCTQTTTQHARQHLAQDELTGRGAGRHSGQSAPRFTTRNPIAKSAAASAAATSSSVSFARPASQMDRAPMPQTQLVEIEDLDKIQDIPY